MGSHKFSLFYSQRLAYIRNKRDEKRQKGETREGRDNERRTGAAGRGGRLKREERAKTLGTKYEVP